MWNNGRPVGERWEGGREGEGGGREGGRERDKGGWEGGREGER